MLNNLAEMAEKMQVARTVRLKQSLAWEGKMHVPACGGSQILRQESLSWCIRDTGFDGDVDRFRSHPQIPRNCRRSRNRRRCGCRRGARCRYNLLS
jgi:hypothetical protein